MKKRPASKGLTISTDMTRVDEGEEELQKWMVSGINQGYTVSLCLLAMRIARWLSTTALET
jgi:hypothetical protein